ncbi:aminoglycoside phosphotransferase family protein [Polynucleobacter sp. MWH-UH23A]|uniref:aminoglycoside phosphotransferase family protein n=1 Tax=Polynucleobacter sp. MWH-UH23A TaxID=1855613 RepID=UPI003364D7B7
MTYHSPTINELIMGLLKRADLDINVDLIEVIRKGGNNQIYRVIQGSQSFIVKKYFQHPDDLRNRLEAEFSFLEFAYEKTPRLVPKPFVKNKEDAIALYEFIEGVKIADSAELSLENLKQASKFVSELNKGDKAYSGNILNASEACFSIEEHLNTIEGRINELAACPESDSSFRRILEDIILKWSYIKRQVYKNCELHNINTEKILKLDERIISPSDFGFHNAIIRDGDVKFIDFEYAGWDDPAKLVGDFFGQVEIPIDIRYLDNFIEESFGKINFSEINMIRSKLLVDAYKIKWCCIVLNIFLQKNLLRRLFANPRLNISLLKDVQINKASKILESFS